MLITDVTLDLASVVGWLKDVGPAATEAPELTYVHFCFIVRLNSFRTGA